jgi:hypothetical protein
MCADSVCIEWLGANENREGCCSKAMRRTHEPTSYFGVLENGRVLIYLFIVVIIIEQ